MFNVQIIATGMYLPKTKIENNILEEKLNLSNDYIYSRTGIKTRFIAKEETIVDMAIKSVQDIVLKEKNLEDVDFIITATTSSNNLMPGISFEIQKYFNIKNAMCMDILAGCGGYINAFDIAKTYIQIGKVKKALVVGVDKLSEYTNKEDVSTCILFGDGAGATLIEQTQEQKLYDSLIESCGQKGDILICKEGKKIDMNGKEVYKYAVTTPVANVKSLLKQHEEIANEIKYIVPHQANMKIIKSIQHKLNMINTQIYTTLEETGNTFCASIPIALNEMFQKNMIQRNDKIILLGYGGGLNTGSILIEI